MPLNPGTLLRHVPREKTYVQLCSRSIPKSTNLGHPHVPREKTYVQLCSRSIPKSTNLGHPQAFSNQAGTPYYARNEARTSSIGPHEVYIGLKSIYRPDDFHLEVSLSHQRIAVLPTARNGRRVGDHEREKGIVDGLLVASLPTLEPQALHAHPVDPKPLTLER